MSSKKALKVRRYQDGWKYPPLYNKSYETDFDDSTKKKLKDNFGQNLEKLFKGQRIYPRPDKDIQQADSPENLNLSNFKEHLNKVENSILCNKAYGNYKIRLFQNREDAIENKALSSRHESLYCRKITLQIALTSTALVNVVFVGILGYIGKTIASSIKKNQESGEKKDIEVDTAFNIAILISSIIASLFLLGLGIYNCYLLSQENKSKKKKRQFDNLEGLMNDISKIHEEIDCKEKALSNLFSKAPSTIKNWMEIEIDKHDDLTLYEKLSELPLTDEEKSALMYVVVGKLQAATGSAPTIPKNLNFECLYLHIATSSQPQVPTQTLPDLFKNLNGNQNPYQLAAEVICNILQIQHKLDFLVSIYQKLPIENSLDGINNVTFNELISKDETIVDWPALAKEAKEKKITNVDELKEWLGSKNTSSKGLS